MISLINNMIPDRMPELPMFRDLTIDDDQLPEEVQKALSALTTLGGSPTGVFHRHPNVNSNNHHVQTLEHLLSEPAAHIDFMVDTIASSLSLNDRIFSDENASRLLGKLANANGEVLE